MSFANQVGLMSSGLPAVAIFDVSHGAFDQIVNGQALPENEFRTLINNEITKHKLEKDEDGFYLKKQRDIKKIEL